MYTDTIISIKEVNDLIRSLIQIFMDKNRIKRTPKPLNHSIFETKFISWTFSNRMTRSAGYAYKKSKEMKFSAKIFAEMSKFEMYQTIAHETAHIIQFIIYPNSKPHGREWKSIMIDLGFEPKIYHNTIIKEHRNYTGTCMCRTHVLGKVRYKRLKMGHSKYRCSICKYPIKIKE